MKATVFMRPAKSSSDEVPRSVVCFRVRDKEVDIKTASEITVNDRYWDADALRYKRTEVIPKEEQRRVERQIAAVIERATATYSPAKANGDWLRQTIADVLHPVADNQPDLFAYLHKYCERPEGTENMRNLALGLEKRLMRYRSYRREIDGETDFNLYIETITIEEMNDFRDYLANEHALRTEHPQFYARFTEFRSKLVPKPLSNTTLTDAMNLLCAFLHWCKRMEYTDNRVYEQYGCKAPIHGDPFFLTVEERNALYDADLNDNPRLAVIRDIFVFHCYVGCRVGDLMRLTRKNVMDGFLEYVPQKTKKCQAKTVRLPLHEKARAILARYDEADGRLLPFKCIAVYNKGIRELLKECGINRMVTILDTHGYVSKQKPLYEIATSHTARKTFIGNLYNKVSDPNLIASMSGHVEGSRAFNRYRTIGDDLKRKLVDLIN